MNRTAREYDSVKDIGAAAQPQATPEWLHLREELTQSLRTILRRDGENELNRLILDMCEADQLQPIEHEGIRYWQPCEDCRFASRVFAFEDEINAAMALLCFKRKLVFSVEVGPPLDVLWLVRETPSLDDLRR